MKTALVLLGFFVTLASAKFRNVLLEGLLDISGQCKESLKTSEDAMKLVEAFEGSDNKEVQCLYACAASQAGILNSGKMDFEKLESFLQSIKNPDDQMTKLTVQVLKDCKRRAEISDDNCEVAGSYMQCGKEKARIAIL